MKIYWLWMYLLSSLQLELSATTRASDTAHVPLSEVNDAPTRENRNGREVIDAIQKEAGCD